VNINKGLDKAWEGKSFKEVAEAPVSALAGVTEKDAELLAQAFGIKTIRDLTNDKHHKWARAIHAACASRRWGGCRGPEGHHLEPRARRPTGR
jgi:hypothetical protein